MKNFIKKVKDIPDKYFITVVASIALLIIFSICLYEIKNNEKYNIEAVSLDVADSSLNIEENYENTLPVETTEDVETPTMDQISEESSEITEKDKKEIKSNSNKATYYIKVNYSANVVTVYTKDANGEYTVPYKAMLCSTGTATPTSGVYKMSGKYRWLSLFGGVNGQYCSRITGHILFHSVPYIAQSPDTLEYWEYDKLGTSASAGCIRLTVANAKWIYDNCPNGTYVEFYTSSDPGPLGRPSSQKISSNVDCRNWDPTDSASGNPWHNYVPPKIENKPIENNSIQETPPSKQEENKNNEEKNNEEESEDKEENKVNEQNKTPNENKLPEQDNSKNENDNSGKPENNPGQENSNLNTTEQDKEEPNI